MAIQVSGTEVISNSRVLSNVTGLKTVNSTSLLGSGDIAAGASTVYGAVGTYVMACYLNSWSDAGSSTNMAGVLANTTYAGSTLMSAAMGTSSVFGADSNGNFARFQWGDNAEFRLGNPTIALSGTWRLMGNHTGSSAPIYSTFALYVRIS